MTTLETLKAARAKIADEKHWTKGAFARDVKGFPAPTLAEHACQWCAVGAIYAVSNDADRVISILEQFVRGRNVAIFNDSHTHRQVLARFDRAIASLEAV